MLKRLLLALALLVGAATAHAAFPTVGEVTASTQTTSSTTIAVAMPATVDAGDLLLMFVTNHFNNLNCSSVTLGFTEDADEQIHNQVGRLCVFSLDAVGTEDSGTSTVTFSGTALSAAANVVRITAATWAGDRSTDIERGTHTAGNGTTCNPASLTASWGSKDNLWIASIHHNTSPRTISVYPTNYDDNQTDTLANASGNSDSIHALATRELAAATDDPATFTLNLSNDFECYTMVVEPAGNGGPSAALLRRRGR